VLHLGPHAVPMASMLTSDGSAALMGRDILLLLELHAVLAIPMRQLDITAARMDTIVPMERRV